MRAAAAQHAQPVRDAPEGRIGQQLLGLGEPRAVLGRIGVGVGVGVGVEAEHRIGIGHRERLLHALEVCAQPGQRRSVVSADAPPMLVGERLRQHDRPPA